MQTKRSQAQHLHELICSAIAQRRQLRFRYEGRERAVCPVLYGRGKDDRCIISAYQIGGQSASGPVPGWRLFCVDEIHDCRTNAESATYLPAPLPTEHLFKEIYAQI